MKRKITSFISALHLKRLSLFSLILFMLNSNENLNAQVLITNSGSYTQNFDALVNTGNATWTDNTTIPNWYSQRTGTGTTYTAGTGSGNSGGLYSFGATGSTERSLGTVGSNNATAGGFAHGVQLKNTSGGTVNNIQVGYTLEQWRNSGTNVVNQLYCYYKISQNIIDSLNPPDTFKIPPVNINAINGWTQISGLTLVAPISTGTAAALDGNATANRVSVAGFTIPGLTLANNEYLMIKWDDSNHVTSDHGLGIDDVSISWTVSATATPSLSATTLTDFGNTCLNTTAGPNNFSLSGSNLTNASITVGPLAGFTFSSTSGGTYSPTLTITQPGGTLTSSMVYVKFTPTLAQSYNGNIPVAGGGATAINVAATGSGTSSVTPLFTQVDPICAGGTFTLPTTSTNGVSGGWSPNINNTTTTTYTFTPSGSCATTASMTVVVNNTPTTLTSTAATAITSTGATAGASVSQGCAAITSYGVEYSTTTGFTPGTGTQVASTNLAAGSYTSTITGLSASTTYYYVTYAVTATGTVYGMQMSFTTSASTPTTATGIVISQVYGAGGNSGSIFNADYVELHNKTNTSQTLTGYSIQYASAAATGNWSGKAKIPTATIPAGGYYLVQMSSASTLNGAPLPTPDYISSPTISMSASNGRVALVSDTITLIGCPVTSNIADLVGYGTSICSETAAIPALDSTKAGFRNNNGCDDSNNNLADFTLNTPAPRNSASPVAVCGVVPTIPTLSSSTLTSFGTICLGTVAGPNSFVINGSNLTTANIVVGPLTGYAFSSTSGGTYSNTLTITQSGGTLAATTVYVNFTPTAAQSYNGSIPVSGGGVANSINVSVTGVGSSTVTPSFTQVAPVCSGTNFSLPATSTNGVTGDWTPNINNTTTTTYTFTPGINQCAVSTTMTVVITPSTTPEFTQVAPICSGENFTLPTTSNNGVNGAWTPSINNTATTTYTFAPAAGQCAPSVTMTVEVSTSNTQTITGDSTSITANSAVLHGSIAGTPCAPVTEYGIEYSGVNGFTIGTKVPSTNIANGLFSSAVNGLVQNTVYFYKAYTKTGSTITYGEQKLFITSAIPAGLTVYGTPIVRGTNVHYSLSGIKPGHYAVRVFNSVGQLVYQKDMILQVNFIDDNFILPAKLPIGLYTLQVFNPTFKIQKSMMVQ